MGTPRSDKNNLNKWFEAYASVFALQKFSEDAIEILWV